mmetsp:Transcript_43537/g.125856  ORF Transcript_43537/g.125856 Transcript_43537/m.125856 type:complete len:644 (+) Transcript_43537:1103-3034(+)
MLATLFPVGTAEDLLVQTPTSRPITDTGVAIKVVARDAALPLVLTTPRSFLDGPLHLEVVEIGIAVIARILALQGRSLAPVADGALLEYLRVGRDATHLLMLDQPADAGLARGVVAFVDAVRVARARGGYRHGPPHGAALAGVLATEDLLRKAPTLGPVRGPGLAIVCHRSRRGDVRTTLAVVLATIRLLANAPADLPIVETGGAVVARDAARRRRQAARRYCRRLHARRVARASDSLAHAAPSLLGCRPIFVEGEKANLAIVGHGGRRHRTPDTCPQAAIGRPAWTPRFGFPPVLGRRAIMSPRLGRSGGLCGCRQPLRLLRHHVGELDRFLQVATLLGVLATPLLLLEGPSPGCVREIAVAIERHLRGVCEQTEKGAHDRTDADDEQEVQATLSHAPLRLQMRLRHRPGIVALPGVAVWPKLLVAMRAIADVLPPRVNLAVGGVVVRIIEADALSGLLSRAGDERLEHVPYRPARAIAICQHVILSRRTAIVVRLRGSHRRPVRWRRAVCNRRRTVEELDGCVHVQRLAGETGDALVAVRRTRGRRGPCHVTGGARAQQRPAVELAHGDVRIHGSVLPEGAETWRVIPPGPVEVGRAVVLAHRVHGGPAAAMRPQGGHCTQRHSRARTQQQRRHTIRQPAM